MLLIKKNKNECVYHYQLKIGFESQVWELLDSLFKIQWKSTLKKDYRTRTIITLYTFYPLFEVHLCTVTFDLMYG